MLVVAVLLLLLGNVRGGLIVAAAIPLSMLFAFTGMVQAGPVRQPHEPRGDRLRADRRRLGRHDREHRPAARRGRERPARHARTVIREAGQEVARPIFFAVLIIIIVYLPILTLEGVEGKMFRPMALTVVFALIGSLILALTLMPVLARRCCSGSTAEEHEPRLVHWLKERYRPIARPDAGATLV